jgi:hypoxanthine-DNA glycosylase
VLLTGLPPIASRDARVLILGSMPGEASLRAGQYYAHRANLFWPIMAALCGRAGALSYAERRRMLLDHRIALWDVVHRCRRPGSLDSAIARDSVEPNDIAGFLDDHRGIHTIFFNGAAAEQLYRRHLLASVARESPALCYQRLPSTSPANASWSRERKLRAWHAVIEALESR